MSGSVKLFLVAALTIALTLSLTRNGFAVTELAYDSGVSQSSIWANMVGVRFSLPERVSSALLVYIRWSEVPLDAALTIYVTWPDHQAQVSGSPIMLAPLGHPKGTGCPPGWRYCCGLDLSGHRIMVTGDFFIILYKAETYSFQIDTGPANGHSYVSPYPGSLAELAPLPLGSNFLIRIEIDPISFIDVNDPFSTILPEYSQYGFVTLLVTAVGLYTVILRKPSVFKLRFLMLPARS